MKVYQRVFSTLVFVHGSCHRPPLIQMLRASNGTMRERLRKKASFQHQLSAVVANSPRAGNEFAQSISPKHFFANGVVRQIIEQANQIAYAPAFLAKPVPSCFGTNRFAASVIRFRPCNLQHEVDGPLLEASLLGCGHANDGRRKTRDFYH